MRSSTLDPLPAGPHPAMREQSRRYALAATALGLLVSVLCLEIAARVWIAATWPPDKVTLFTTYSASRGRFVLDATTGYRLKPAFRDPVARVTHNEAGFRGPALLPGPADGALRIVLAGASTVYGLNVPDESTSAVWVQRLLQTDLPGGQIEVVNAGVPGWTSAETIRGLPRVLALKPDIVVVVDGRNDAFPQLFNHYRDDYSHYRDYGKDQLHSNYWHKGCFRLSHLFMALSTRGAGRFGFSTLEENPAYATIRYANRPTTADLARNLGDARRGAAFRQNLQRVVAALRENHVLPLLATLPFRATHFASGVFPTDARTADVVARRVALNNDIVRNLGRELDVAVVETVALTRDDLLVDDCHFNEAGERAFADAVRQVLRPFIVLLDERSARVPARRRAPPTFVLGTRD